MCYKEEFFEKCFLCSKFCENEYYQAEGKVIYFLKSLSKYYLLYQSLHQECLDAYLDYQKSKKIEVEINNAEKTDQGLLENIKEGDLAIRKTSVKVAEIIEQNHDSEEKKKEGNLKIQ